MEILSGIWDDDMKIANCEFISHGFECYMKRNHVGVWCGHVQLPLGHPDYESGDDVDINVHGGITYAFDGRFGFDCCHSGDIVPAISTTHSESLGIKTPSAYHYWTLEEAKIELMKMAAQFYSRGNIPTI